jgi:hypothetical protein
MMPPVIPSLSESFMRVMVVSPPTKGGSGNPGKRPAFVWIWDAMPNGISGTNKILLVLNLFHEF